MTNKKEGIKVFSLSQFIEVLLNKSKELGSIDPIWFRGESSENFTSKLIPTLYRETTFCEVKHQPDVETLKRIHQVEQNIDAHFSQKSTIFFVSKGIKDSSWNRYFLKQHYRIKTRLLDWTENALIALLFALSDPNQNLKEHNAIVWLLSPHKLNNFSINKLLPKELNRKLYIIPTCNKLPKKKKNFIEKISDPSKELLIDPTQILRKYYRLDCDEKEEMFPLAIYPPHLDERMAAQKACFTLFGNVVSGLNYNDSEESFLDYVIIDAKSKFKILKELNKIGIDYFSAYPDLDALGSTINNQNMQDFEGLKIWDTLYHHSENYNKKSKDEE